MGSELSTAYLSSIDSQGEVIFQAKYKGYFPLSSSQSINEVML